MRVVVDSNRVQTEELAGFLSASPSNRAVVTDWLMMEAYKGNTLKSIYKSLGVLARHPRQVIVLKNTGACMRTRVGPQMSKRLIWREHTTGFPEFIREVESAQAGDRLVEGSLLWRGEMADERMRELERHAAAMLDQHRAMLGALTPEDLATIRGTGGASPDILLRLVAIARTIAEGYRRELGIADRRPRAGDLSSDFLFRVGVATTSWFLEWTRTGSQPLIRSDRMRNDYVDAMLSVFGTYYNGIMTGDAKLILVHQVSRTLLAALGARLPPPYAVGEAADVAGESDETGAYRG